MEQKHLSPNQYSLLDHLNQMTNMVINLPESDTRTQLLNEIKIAKALLRKHKI